MCEAERGDSDMIDSAGLFGLFPTAAELAGEHVPPGPMHQRAWLIGGQLRPSIGET
jgi:hypothetical protein